MRLALVGARGRWKQGDLADSALVGAGQRWWAMIQVLLQLFQALAILVQDYRAPERPHLAQHTASMLLVTATEHERANRVADVTTEFVDAQFVGVQRGRHEPRNPGRDRRLVRYQLMGDANAKAPFYPPETCGLCRDGAWMRLRRNNSPP